MIDETEDIRRARQAQLNAEAARTERARTELEQRHGRVWSTDELRAEFDVLGFMAPLIVVTRKRDGAKGSLEFQHEPRFYFNWQAH